MNIFYPRGRWTLYPLSLGRPRLSGLRRWPLINILYVPIEIDEVSGVSVSQPRFSPSKTRVDGIHCCRRVLKSRLTDQPEVGFRYSFSDFEKFHHRQNFRILSIETDTYTPSLFDLRNLYSFFLLLFEKGKYLFILEDNWFSFHEKTSTIVRYPSPVRFLLRIFQKRNPFSLLQKI